MEVTKCPHCKTYYFVIEGLACPVCAKNKKDELQIFKDLFGIDNPFDDTSKDV